ncbi:MAG TPA: hypothetical protein VMD59_07005, partial [Acidimicrobiales bacterium]|nr:hypothetical protein [Acidimicrobiales bacterium]
MTLLLRDLNVVDVEHGRVVPNCAVLIEGSRIAAVGPVEEIAGGASGGGASGGGSSGGGSSAGGSSAGGSSAGGAAAASANGSVGVEVVDCGGRFLVPGMIDAHIHLRGTRHRGPSQGQPVPAHHEEQDRAEVISRLHSFLYCGV